MTDTDFNDETPTNPYYGPVLCVSCGRRIAAPHSPDGADVCDPCDAEVSATEPNWRVSMLPVRLMRALWVAVWR